MKQLHAQRVDTTKTSRTDLLIRLRNLHQGLIEINIDLRDAAPVDDETIERLGTLVTDVGNLVDRTPKLSEQPEPREHQPIVDQITKFEIGHPKVTQILSQVTDLLAMMGI